MNLLNFFRRFPTEQSCKEHFKRERIKQGVVCKKCNGLSHYWLKSKEQFECKHCHFRTTLRSGTVMEASKLPFQYWYATMHLITSTKKSFSAKELQRQLGHKRYEPIWAMLHKLRIVMGYRDSQYMLKDRVELDEGFFSNTDSLSSKKTPVLVSAESIPSSNVKKKFTHNRVARYIKMKVLDNRTKASIFYQTQKMIDNKSTVLTDGLQTYKKLNDIVAQHQRIVVKDKKNVSKIFPWVHTAISNFRKILVGIHHGVKSKYLQNYLNEFCYKFNRRFFEDCIFDRLIVAAISSTYYQNRYGSG